MAKKLICLVLTLALCLSCTAPALAADSDVASRFPAVKTYSGFPDVENSSSNWYYAPVKTCYETGMMVGADTGFLPESPIKISEVATIAARIGEVLSGKAIAKDSSANPWYRPYVEYLESYGVTGLLPTVNATREDFFQMLSKVVPAELLSPINSIAALPDSVDPALLQFYNAGILSGIDEYGTFSGRKNLSRAEAAAMIARLVRPELRQSFTPKDVPGNGSLEEVAPLCEAAGVTGDTVMLKFDDGTVVYAPAYLNYLVNTALPYVREFWLERGLTEEEWWEKAITLNGKSMISYAAISQITTNYFTRLYLQGKNGASPSSEEVDAYLAKHSVLQKEALNLDIQKTFSEKS